MIYTFGISPYRLHTSKTNQTIHYKNQSLRSLKVTSDQFVSTSKLANKIAPHFSAIYELSDRPRYRNTNHNLASYNAASAEGERLYHKGVEYGFTGDDKTRLKELREMLADAQAKGFKLTEQNAKAELEKLGKNCERDAIKIPILQPVNR